MKDIHTSANIPKPVDAEGFTPKVDESLPLRIAKLLLPPLHANTNVVDRQLRDADLQ